MSFLPMCAQRLEGTTTKTYRPLLRGRYVFLIVCSFIASISSSQTLPADKAPNFPLNRTDHRIYDVAVQVMIPWNQPIPPLGGADTPILWPLLPRTDWSYLDTTNVAARLENGPHVQQDSQAWHLAVASDIPNQWHLAIPVPENLAGRLVFQVQFRSHTFSSSLNEQAAFNIPWPDTWPEDVAAFLEPSDYIKSDRTRFRNAVDEVLPDKPHSVPIHVAAKMLIRHCLVNIKSTGQYTAFDGQPVRGFHIRGALAAASRGSGSGTDLVCACVAILRAAGIPARPVIGVTIADTVGTGTVPAQYVVWAEYALPNVGWVPFNPDRMRGTVDNLSLRSPWQGLGTMPWLNRRVPLAYSFVAGGKGKAFDAVGPWGWVPIYRKRPLPVPASQPKIPLYRSADEDAFVLIPYAPSIQNLHLTFISSPNSG